MYFFVQTNSSLSSREERVRVRSAGLLFIGKVTKE